MTHYQSSVFNTYYKSSSDTRLKASMDVHLQLWHPTYPLQSLFWV